MKKLEFGVLKLYLVTAFSAGKSEKVTDFFTKLAIELHSQPEWKEWFCKSIGETNLICWWPNDDEFVLL